MQVQYLIIGQGIAGTLLSYLLWKNNKSFLIIDEPHNAPVASRVAGAVINPVNVNQWSAVPGYASHLDAALKFYAGMEASLGISLIQKLSMLVFPENGRKKQLFEGHRQQLVNYIQLPDDEEQVMGKKLFNAGFGMVKLSPVWKVNAAELLSGWSGFLKEKGLLIREHCKTEDCHITGEGVRYREIIAEKIIFCEGAATAKNPFFSKLPFTPNRGEALLLSIPALPADHIYHHRVRLVPAGEGLFWCGSNYRWQFEDLLPDQNWRQQTEDLLTKWLTVSFKTVDHRVAERPTTAGQQVFVGLHPAFPRVAIFNGLGTKGFSRGPALAGNLYDQLENPTLAEGMAAASLKKWL